MPDASLYDGHFRAEKSVMLTNWSLDTSTGFIVAVVVRHAVNAKLTVSFEDHHLIMLNAAVAKPAPLYNLP